MEQVRQCDLSMVGAEGVDDLLQCVAGLREVAKVVQDMGLVQVDKEKRTFSMHQLVQEAMCLVLGWMP